MADFCTKCAQEMGFPSADIDIEKIAESLDPDTYTVLLCEGCEMAAIGKDSAGQIYLAFPDGEQHDPVNYTVRWITLDEFYDDQQ